MVGILLVAWLSFLAPSPTLAASAPSEFRTGEFVPTARRVQYHGTRSRWVDLASRHCPRFGSDGLLAIPLPAPIVPPTKKQQRKKDGGDSSSPPALLHGTYKVQFAFDGERVLTPWLTVAREDLDGKRKESKKKKRSVDGNDEASVADVPVVDLVLARAGRELLGGGATRARVSRAPQDYVAAHGGLADEWRSGERPASSNSSSEAAEQKWPRTLPIRVRWAARPGADLAAGASTLLIASLLAALAASLASLAGHEGVLRELVEGAVALGAEEAEEVLMGRSSILGGGGNRGGAGIGSGSVQLATTAAAAAAAAPAPPSAAAAAAFARPQLQPQTQPFQYQYQQQAPAPRPQPQQQFRPQQQQPAPPSSFAPPPSSSLPVQQQQQQQQHLPPIAPPPASFTPQQQYAYYQQMHSYQQRQQQQQGQQAPYYSRPPSSFRPSSSKPD